METLYGSDLDYYEQSSFKESFAHTVSDEECSHFERMKTKRKVYRKRKGDKRKGPKNHVRQNITICTKANLSPMLTSNSISGLIEQSQDSSDKDVEVDVVINQEKQFSVKQERKSVPVFDALKSPEETTDSSQNRTGEVKYIFIKNVSTCRKYKIIGLLISIKINCLTLFSRHQIHSSSAPTLANL